MMRVAVIGFGFIGYTHAVAIAANKNLKLAAIIDKDPKALQDKAGNFAVDKSTRCPYEGVPLYRNLKDCLNEQELDAVHICVHTHLHVPIATEALMQGLHVLLEKPFSLEVDAAEKLIQLAEAKSRVLMIGHVVRFADPYVKLRQMVEEKTYGNPEFFMFSRCSGIPNWGEWMHPETRSRSGGGLFDLLIHDVDFAYSLLGKPEEMNTTNYTYAMSHQDYTVSNWSYNGGKTRGVIIGGNCFHTAMPWECKFQIRFEHASVEFSSRNPEYILVADKDGSKKIDSCGFEGAFDNEIGYFADCAAKNVKPQLCTPQSALETVKICLQMIQ